MASNPAGHGYMPQGQPQPHVPMNGATGGQQHPHMPGHKPAVDTSHHGELNKLMDQILFPCRTDMKVSDFWYWCHFAFWLLLFLLVGWETLICVWIAKACHSKKAQQVDTSMHHHPGYDPEMANSHQAGYRAPQGQQPMYSSMPPTR